MGNSLVVSKPYIIDEYPSDDDDDDDDDYFSYESAFEGPDSRTNPPDSDKGNNLSESKGDALSRQISVDSKVVSNLVSEVEQLLSYLANNDLEGAQRAARLLKGSPTGSGQLEGQEEEEQHCLLPEEARETPHSDAGDLEREIIACTQKEGQLCQESVVDNNGWSEEERQALEKLDEDLSQFEEDEARIVCTEPKTPPIKTEKLSAIPTFRPAASQPAKVEDVADGLHDFERGAFVPIVHKETHYKVSAIPRFSTFSTSLEKDQQLPQTLTLSDKQAEEVTDTKETNIEDTININGDGHIARDTAITLVSSQEQNGDETIIPVSREIKVVLDGQNYEDDLIKVTDTAAWEINISDFRGRPKKIKKRSGIPSLWTDPSSKAVLKTSTKLPSSPTALPLPSSPEPDSTELAPSSPSKITEVLPAASQSVSISKSIPPQQDTNNPSQRKIFDLKRWVCTSRPQYKTSCGISSVVSCWNFLFSTLGHGSLSPLSQEQAIRILGYDGPCEKIRFGPFTGNLTLLRWFRELNNHFRVRGRCYIMYKPNGKNRTVGVTSNIALDKLKTGLQDPGTTFIYHCHNHYFCPIGYEESPQDPQEAYSGRLSSDSVEHTWILIGDTSRKYGPFHCKSWEKICQDLNMNRPEYINIRKSWKGVMKKKVTKKTTGNIHCIMCFQKPKDLLQSMIPAAPGKSGIPRSSRLPRRSPSPSSRRSMDSDFKFSRDEGENNEEEEMEEERETLTSDVSSDEDMVRLRKN